MTLGTHVPPDVDEVKAAVRTALGQQPGTVLFTHAHIVNVIT